MNEPIYLLASANQELSLVWNQSTVEAKVIIVILVIFSIFAWSVMASKAVQMRRARKLNEYFNAEFRSQAKVLGIFDRRVQVAAGGAARTGLAGEMVAAVRGGLGGRAVSLGIESIRFQPAATTTAGRLLGLFVGLSP